MIEFIEHGRSCHTGRREQMLEKWNKLSDEEKLDMANKHVERMGQDPFTIEAFQARCDRWTSLSDGDKAKFIEVHKHMQNKASVEALDKKWAKWNSLSDEEKQKVVDKHKSKVHEMHKRF